MEFHLFIKGFCFDCCKRNKGKHSKFFLKALWRVVIVILLQVIHLECGQYLLQQDLQKVQAHCESFLPALEEYHKENGAFPSELQQLPSFKQMEEERVKRKEELPWILKEVSAKQPQGVPYYRAIKQGKDFEFFFDDPADIGLQQYVYTGSSGAWSLEQNVNYEEKLKKLVTTMSDTKPTTTKD